MSARDGDWHTQVYFPRVKSLELWEIEPACLSKLQKNLPGSKIKITNSFDEIKLSTCQYDFIVVDNPQSVYGNSLYCEHFELFPHIFRRLKNEGIMILNVNVQPYNFQSKSEWWRRRSEFYKTEKPEKLTLGFLESHYRSLSAAAGYTAEWVKFVKRNEFIYYLVLYIKKS